MILNINEVKKGVFKIEDLSEVDKPVDKLSKFLSKPENFVLSFRASDNSYHEVNSSASIIIQKNKNLIEKGIGLPSIAAGIAGSKELKVKRYLIWKNGKEAYLVGEVLTALKKVSNSTN